MPQHTYGGYMDAAQLADTGAEQLQLTDASIKRLMAAGFTQGVPNVARLTGVNVAKRTLAPTRYMNVSVVVPTGADIIAQLDLGIVAIAAFPFQMFTNQLAADREETEGDYIAGIQVNTAVWTSVNPLAAPAANAVIPQDNSADALEQAIGEFYGLAVFPSSGVQSPLIANTPLREFAQDHRLSGPDGYRGIPPVRWSDNFAHIDLLQSANPVGAVVRPTLFNGSGGNLDVSVTIAVRLRTFAG